MRFVNHFLIFFITIVIVDLVVFIYLFFLKKIVDIINFIMLLMLCFEI